MKKRWTVTALGFLVAAFFAALPARGDDVDQRIRALEDELSRLKSEQAQVKAEQIEMKKDATAAAAALPSFSYRPGSGMMVEAADKSWSFRASMESHFRLLFEKGRDEVGRTNGEVMGRRFRPTFFYCLSDCLWEIETSLDLDGFGTGNAKNSLNTGGSSILQRGALHVHLENINPWLPTLTTGMDISTSHSTARQGSSSIGSQLEYDLLSRNVGPNTGRAGNGFTFDWDNKSLSAIGIPGRLTRFQFASATISEGDDGLSSFKDRRSYSYYIGIEPFSQIKNKWIQGLLIEHDTWFCNNGGTRGNTDNGCDRFRIQDNGDNARQTLFDTGGDSVGKGLFTYMMPGIAWTVGPYRLRVIGGFAQAADDGGGRGKKRAHNFLIGHDLYIWSPKGFLTGSATTPGSILLGTHFERNDLSCDLTDASGINRCTTATGSRINGGQFHRETVLLREWDIWYVIAPRMSIGAAWLWYDASNLRTGAGNACQNLDICSGGERPGTGGSWVDWSITWRYTF
jgi:hypothetical protein